MIPSGGSQPPPGERNTSFTETLPTDRSVAGGVVLSLRL